VELVQWSKLIDGQRLPFGRERRERRLDAVSEASAAIVLAHFGSGIAHNVSPGTVADANVSSN
jgi:hypothetical protein